MLDTVHPQAEQEAKALKEAKEKKEAVAKEMRQKETDTAIREHSRTILTEKMLDKALFAKLPSIFVPKVPFSAIFNLILMLKFWLWQVGSVVQNLMRGGYEKSTINVVVQAPQRALHVLKN